MQRAQVGRGRHSLFATPYTAAAVPHVTEPATLGCAHERACSVRPRRKEKQRRATPRTHGYPADCFRGRRVAQLAASGIRHVSSSRIEGVRVRRRPQYTLTGRVPGR